MTCPEQPNQTHAESLLETAVENPDSISSTELVELFVYGTSAARRLTADAYETVVEVRPNIATSVASKLQALLDSPDQEIRQDTAATISHLAAENPLPFKQTVPSLLSMIAPPIEIGREHAVFALLVLSPSFPDAVKPGVPDLLDIVKNEQKPPEESGTSELEDTFEIENANRERRVIRVAALRSVLHVLTAQPATAIDLVDRVAPLLNDSNADIRATACQILSVIAQEDPRVVYPHFEKLIYLLVTDPAYPVPLKAASSVVHIADEFPKEFADTVADDAEKLVLFLEDSDPYIRGLGVALLSYLAEHHPDRVTPAVERLCDVLTDDNPSIRANSVRTLHHAQAVEAFEELREVAKNDPNTDVQQIAAEAIRDFRQHSQQRVHGNEESQNSVVNENI